MRLYLLYFHPSMVLYYIQFDSIIETDHLNLDYLDKLSESNRKFLHWKLLLSDFNFFIVHIPGLDNIMADALSRMPSSDDPVMLLDTPANSDDAFSSSDKFQTLIIRGAHGALAGHEGVHKTLKKLRDNGFSWLHMMHKSRNSFLSVLFAKRFSRTSYLRCPSRRSWLTGHFMSWVSMPWIRSLLLRTATHPDGDLYIYQIR